MPTNSSRKQDISLLSRSARAGLVTVSEAAKLLHMSNHQAATRLARLHDAGWLMRVKRGTYFIRPLEAGPHDKGSAPDPWPIASVMFDPCYIGGWTAAHHWGLTDQLFRSTFVVTSAHIRKRSPTILELEFRLARIRDRSRVTATPTIWRGTQRVRLSSIERTVADALATPSWVGGFRHLVDILASALSTGTFDVDRLANELRANSSGAAFKRLGYLVDTLWPQRSDLLTMVGPHITSGIVRLDPNLPKRGRLSKRWLLWINTTVSGGDWST
jgi:predicted transcriptional regulator of viral defense system